MVTKVPSPFASPFAKTLLAVFWIAYPGMLVALAIGHDVNLLAIVAWWTIVLPWISWAFLSGVQVEAGRRVGGGPMYPRVALAADEVLLFAAPVLTGVTGGHLFVTNQRVIVLPIRFFGTTTRTIRLSQITGVDTQSKGLGFPMPKRRIQLIAVDSTLALAPWAGPGFAEHRLARFMGTVSVDAFLPGILAALKRAGVAVAPNS